MPACPGYAEPEKNCKTRARERPHLPTISYRSPAVGGRTLVARSLSRSQGVVVAVGQRSCWYVTARLDMGAVRPRGVVRCATDWWPLILGTAEAPLPLAGLVRPAGRRTATLGGR